MQVFASIILLYFNYLYYLQMAVDGYRSGRCYGTGVMRCRNAIGRSVGTA